ncbi:unnamed protein product [Moneuplotes crassus]|uniref:Fungal lipase-type domain-containing protein n=1 Tax=Euplotes crassus TaxID=5936 RepID=A0AAD2D0C3_EUPCR|nr:unnamed protein product [Moneuplotes crassus]
MKVQIFLIGLILFMSTASCGYDASFATKMVYVSGLSYCQADQIVNDKCGKATDQVRNTYKMDVEYAMDNGKSVNSITMAVLKSDNDKQYFVGFSGTRETSQLIAEIAESFPRSYEIHPEIGEAKVMDYFYQRYLDDFRDPFLQKIKEIIKGNPSYGITFTGHSLGGAMTVHAAADFILSGIDTNRKVQIYSFGQPRVGDHKFIDGFASKVSGFYRVTHSKDIVAHIPPCITDLHDGCTESGILPFYPYHAPQEIWYNEDSSSYTQCSTKEGEDPTCSNSNALNDSVDDHLKYLGLPISGLTSYPASLEELLKA